MKLKLMTHICFCMCLFSVSEGSNLLRRYLFELVRGDDRID